MTPGSRPQQPNTHTHPNSETRFTPQRHKHPNSETRFTPQTHTHTHTPHLRDTVHTSDTHTPHLRDTAHTSDTHTPKLRGTVNTSETQTSQLRLRLHPFFLIPFTYKEKSAFTWKDGAEQSGWIRCKDAVEHAHKVTEDRSRDPTSNLLIAEWLLYHLKSLLPQHSNRTS